MFWRPGESSRTFCDNTCLARFQAHGQGLCIPWSVHASLARTRLSARKGCSAGPRGAWAFRQGGDSSCRSEGNVGWPEAVEMGKEAGVWRTAAGGGGTGTQSRSLTRGDPSGPVAGRVKSCKVVGGFHFRWDGGFIFVLVWWLMKTMESGLRKLTKQETP